MRTVIFSLLIASWVGQAFGAPRQQAAEKAPAAAATPQSETGVFEGNVQYGSAGGAELRLDVYKPADPHQPCPAIILIHGGGWTSFDKSTMRGMGEFLARSGFVAFAVDYRLFQGPNQNRWPAQLDDVQRAVRWVRANAAKYGVNPDRVGAFGHSAGAQLAALLGMEDTRDNSDPALSRYSSRVEAVVDVSGPTDFTVNHDPESVTFMTSFLGADYANHPEVWRDASPAHHVAKENAPFLIVHGTRDEAVSMSQAEKLYEALKAQGVPVFLEKVDDEHTFRNPDVRHQLALETREFFNHYLGSTP